jgi:DNA repair protein RadA/Sms
LAVAAAIASSSKDAAVRAGAVLIGEIGLAGELRMPGQMAARLREASKLGFKTAIIPKSLRGSRHSGLVEGWPKGLEVVEARSIQQALEAALMPAPGEAPRGHKLA